MKREIAGKEENGERRKEKEEGGEISHSSCYVRVCAGEQGGENAEGRKREEMEEEGEKELEKRERGEVELGGREKEKREREEEERKRSEEGEGEDLLATENFPSRERRGGRTRKKEKERE